MLYTTVINLILYYTTINISYSNNTIEVILVGGVVFNFSIGREIHMHRKFNPDIFQDG